MGNKTARSIIFDLVEKWDLYSIFTSSRVKTDAGHYRPGGKPGEVIERLSPEEREILKNLKPEDIEDARWPGSRYFIPYKSKEDDLRDQIEHHKKEISKKK